MDKHDKLKLVRQIKSEIESEQRNIAELERLELLAGEDKTHQSQSDATGNDTIDRNTMISVWARVNRLQNVLSRIDDANFGSCIICGENIPLDRLMIVPDTSYCTQHAKDGESR